VPDPAEYELRDRCARCPCATLRSFATVLADLKSPSSSFLPVVGVGAQGQSVDIFMRVAGLHLVTKFRDCVESIGKYSTAMHLSFHVAVDKDTKKHLESEVTRLRTLDSQCSAVTHSRMAASLLTVDCYLHAVENDHASFEILDFETLFETATQAMSIVRAVSQTQGHYDQSLFYISPSLHWILRDIDQVIVLDVDLLFTGDIMQLQRRFLHFSGTALIGLAFEQQPVYAHVLHSYRQRHRDTLVGSPASQGGFPGFNSGVALLQLERMRQDTSYNDLLMNSDVVSKLLAEYEFKGHLGEQDWFTLIYLRFPHFFHILPCSFNRQLCQWWYLNVYPQLKPLYHSCNETVVVYHGNCGTPIESGIKADLQSGGQDRH
jgi:xylosyl alpha-1,3-xylosyltransferase